MEGIDGKSEKAGELDPKNLSVLSHLGANHLAERNLEAANKTFDRAIVASPQSFSAHGFKAATAVHRKGYGCGREATRPCLHRPRPEWRHYRGSSLASDYCRGSFLRGFKSSNSFAEKCWMPTKALSQKLSVAGVNFHQGASESRKGLSSRLASGGAVTAAKSCRRPSPRCMVRFWQRLVKKRGQHKATAGGLLRKRNAFGG